MFPFFSKNLLQVATRSCDLLSISIFDLLIFTLIKLKLQSAAVVICFQFLSLTYWYSLNDRTKWEYFLLWFAFNFYLWLIDIHSLRWWLRKVGSCDLLSISIFDLLIFTLLLERCRDLRVVICFQFLSLTYWYSLYRIYFANIYVLWFAFNFYLWLIDIHFFCRVIGQILSCDLLSISIFDLLIFTFAIR